MIPVGALLQLQGATEDNVVTQAETTQMIMSVVNSAMGGIVVAFAMLALTRAVGGNPGGHNPGNPGNPSTEAVDIVGRARLKWYEPPPGWAYGEREEGKMRKPPTSARTKTIGSYVIKSERRGEDCSIKLYENLEGWKTKLRGTWTGSYGFECDKKFREVEEAVRQVRFERRTQLRRK